LSNAGIRVRASLDPRASARKGIVLAKRRGFYRGRKRVLSPDGLADARRRADAGDEKAQIARKLGISRENSFTKPLFVVIYAEPEPDWIHIISTRRTTPSERRKYEELG